MAQSTAPAERSLPQRPPSSRCDEAAAGWYGPPGPPPIGAWERRLAERRQPKWDTFSWVTVRALLEAVNHLIVARAPATVRDRRQRYIDRQEADPGPGLPGLGAFGPHFVVDWTRLPRPRFLIAGDPGEADASQYATIDPLLEVHRGGPAWDEERREKSDFTVILSDVIYPSGDVNDYVNGFYVPFREYDRPIYAIPGNHDWYDGLSGFMFHFCGAKPLVARPIPDPGLADRITAWLWRRARRPDEELNPLTEERRRHDLRRRGAEEPVVATGPVQPAPYFAIELAELRLIAIDAGVTGELDAKQGEWLVRMSAGPKPKVLLTGKPILTSGRYRPGPIVWDEPSSDRPMTVDDIVRDRSNHYIAAIGGDSHNYQRFPLRIGDRTIQYVVAGGSGAFLSATHTIPSVSPTAAQAAREEEPIAVSETQFRCYPLRGDSLALFCRRIGPMLFKLLVSAMLVMSASALILVRVITIEADRLRAAGVAAAAVAALVLVILIAARNAGLVTRLVAVAAAFAGAASVLLAIWDSRITVAVIMTLAVPATVALGLVIAYAGRGRLPKAVLDTLPVVPLLALGPALWAPYGLGAWRDMLAYVAAPLCALATLIPLVAQLRRVPGPRRGSAYRAITALAWLGIVGVVVVRFGEEWVAEAIVAVLVLLALVGFAVPLMGPGRRRAHRPRHDALGPAAGTAVAVAVAGLALVGFEALAGRGASAVAAAGIAAVSVVVAALVAAYLLLWLGLVDPRRLRRLRTGEIRPRRAAEYVSETIGSGLPPTRPAQSTQRVPGEDRTAAVVHRLGRRVSSIADTNQPPFYKSFLSAEVEDGQLVISTFGVTGYDDPRRSPSLEDRVAIPLTPGRRAIDQVEPSAASPPAAGDRQDVSFTSRGVRCSAWYYPSALHGRAPCVVIAHGFDGVREQALGDYAKRFNDAGLAALVFDYRCFGSSEGEPRQLFSNPAQLEDWRAAITYARGLDGIDPSRIALWGTSTSGGHVVKLAAEDRRVAAVVTQMPFASGFAQLRSQPITRNVRLLWAGLRDQVSAWLDRDGILIPAAGMPHTLAVVTSRDALSGLARITPPVTTWRNAVHPRFTLTASLYHPGRAAKRVRCPMLVCIADGDRVIPLKPALKMAKHATLRRYRFGHFAMYHGCGFDCVAGDQVKFLTEHLLGQATP